VTSSSDITGGFVVDGAFAFASVTTGWSGLAAWAGEHVTPISNVLASARRAVATFIVCPLLDEPHAAPCRALPAGGRESDLSVALGQL
jgi:hypothetical protein